MISVKFFQQMIDHINNLLIKFSDFIYFVTDLYFFDNSSDSKTKTHQRFIPKQSIESYNKNIIRLIDIETAKYYGGSDDLIRRINN